MQFPKLAGGYLGPCFILMALRSVSSVNFYNPYLYITKIATLLHELHKDLINMNVEDMKVVGIKNYEMEHGMDCAGTFLDIFQHGTKKISTKISNPSVHNITGGINDCVTKLRGDCDNIKKRKERCKHFTHNEEVIRFVEKFLNFSDLLMSWHICGNEFNREYELSEEYDRDNPVSLC